MFFTRYVRGRPKVWHPGMPLYVVEHRYKDDVKSFKKIKNWNSCVPEEVRKNEYELVPYPNERVDVLRRIKSPFVRGVVGPGGIGEAMENEEEEQARYHFLPSGEPATGQRAKVETQVAAGSGASSSALYGASLPLAAPVLSITPLAYAATPGPTPPTVSGATPAEKAIAAESFYPLPAEIRASFFLLSLERQLSALCRIQIPRRRVGRPPLVRSSSSLGLGIVKADPLARIPLLARAATR